MNDDKIKAMWNKTENLMRASNYGSAAIENFLSGKSRGTAQMVKKMIFMDIGLKALVAVTLGVNIFLYWGTTNVFTVCVIGVLVLALLISFQFKMLSRFAEIADHGQSTREKLTSMLSYLKTRFYSTLLTISITYLFVFIAGTLVYFYAVYGQVRPLDGVDIIVFLTFILIGISFNFFTFRSQIKYHIKHLEVCLSDLNENSLQFATEAIENQRKQDRMNKFLLLCILVFGFLMLIAIFMNAFG